MDQAGIISDLLSWLEGHLDQPLSLDNVAAKAGYSKWHLQRMFKDVTGQAIGAYIRARRLSKSAVALRLTARRLERLPLDHTVCFRMSGNVFALLVCNSQQAEADIEAAQARIAIIARMQRAQAERLAVKQEPVVRLTAALQMMARRPLALALVLQLLPARHSTPSAPRETTTWGMS